MQIGGTRPPMDTWEFAHVGERGDLARLGGGDVLAIDEVLHVGTAAVTPMHEVVPVNPQMNVEAE
jgi:hypothetical protein